MFVGSTPSTPGQAGVRHLQEEQGRDALLEALRRRRANDEDVVPFEECASEQEIRERKPRILITNANQLELLLTRQQDFELFTGAPLRFVVLDEAHTYSGATGAEVACLVRRLRAFAGKSSEEVTCIATSATIVDPEQRAEVGPEFLSRLTGVGQESVELVREQYEPLLWPGRRTIPDEPADPYATLEAVLTALGTPPPEGEALHEEAGIDRDALANALASLTGESIDLPEGHVGEALFDHLETTEPVRILMEELEHPRSLEEVTVTLRERLGRTVEPPETSTAEVLAYLALGAFARRGEAPLLRPKLHMFVRGLEGAVVTFEGEPAAPLLHFSARDALGAGPGDRIPTGIFPISVCRTCGQHYMTTHLHGYEVADGVPTGGEAAGETAYWLALADADADGATRVRFTDWFLAEGDPEEEDEGSSRAKATARLDAHRAEGFLCRWCGTIHRDDSASCLNLTCGRPGQLVRIYLVLEEKGFRCLGCGARGGSQGGRASEPIRPLRASTVADVHILAQEMISAAGSDEERRLLIFADNRQDAAFQAGWMRDHARRYRLRYLFVEALTELEQGQGPVSVGDLHADVVRRLRNDRDLARAVAPEAFDGGADESFGRLSDAMLSRFIRIQILREIATAFAQRDGLERWGQLRVVYAGLEPDSSEVVAAAGELELSPQMLADGVASLLDVWRRGRLLHDADEPIFGKWWQAGSDEVLRGFIPFGLTEVSPQGVKLEKAGGDADSYVRAVVSKKGRTGAVDFIGKWGVADPKAAAARVWELVREIGLVTPVKLVGGNGKALPGSSGAHQVDSSRLGLLRQNERYVCSVCGRVHSRPTPSGACTKTYCSGTVAQAEPPENDYNVSLLSRPFAMVTPEEHTAQVPADKRDEIEKSFKRAGGAVNTLVATPTLELGVDIGALDLVLCRNVPPTAANYWQRVGRAGRRRRMAVVYVYCRQAIHDAYFFERPQELLGAPIQPPRFNLKNDVLVRKHVHAAILSELLRIARDDEDAKRALTEAVPQYVGDYLFEGPDNHYRTAPADVSALAGLIDTHKTILVDAVQRVFAAAWPSEAADEVAPQLLEQLVAEAPGELQARVNQLHDRLMWVVDTQSELAKIAAVRPLTSEEERQRDKAGAFIQTVRERHVRTYTLSVLAGEGFLPGYGLYDGGISAFPGWRGGAMSFELSRPPSIAVREFIPGNLLYANRGRYRVSRYHFPIRGQAQRTESYDVEPQTGFVRLSGTTSPGYASGPVVSVEGLPIADVDLALLSPIRDEETDRFQVPVTILGLALRHRRHGVAYRFGDQDVHHVLGQGLRLVNAGPADRVRAQELGYPVCIVCGACRSPYASAREHADFAEWHSGHCGLRPRNIALTANVVADVLHFHGLDDQADAANLGEAIRLGAAQVLSMEPDDLQTLPVPIGDGRYDLFLYDPMPGGSGLLGQIVDRWLEIVAVLEQLLTECAGGCETSCYSCLRTGRNVFWHRLLDRLRALELLAAMAEKPVEGHTLSPQEDAGLVAGAMTTSAVEDRLEVLLNRAGLEGFVGQHEVEIGRPYDRTVPDFAYVDDQVAVYLDGLSAAIHGNEARQRADAIIRGQLEEFGWTVVAIGASHLDDPVVLALDFRRIARALGRGDVADTVVAESAWYEDRVVPESASAVELVDRDSAQPYVRHVPMYSIRAAAGRFLENEEATEEGWVEAPGALRDGMFAVQVEGRSMEPTIPDGSLALFVADPSGGPLPGSREGKIVLAQLHDATDPENGASFTTKRFHSEKTTDEDGNWRHSRIVLQSLNREVEDIETRPDQDVDVIAEFVTVLGNRND